MPAAPATTQRPPATVTTIAPKNKSWSRPAGFSANWAEFAVPYPETDIRRIEIDQAHPTRVWWTGTLSGHFGYIEMLDK